MDQIKYKNFFDIYFQLSVSLVESLGFSHAGLDMETLDVLPMFLEERNQKVHGESDVLNELILSHLHVTNGHTQAKNLLHLELDGGLQIVHLRIQVVHMSYHGGELSCLNIKDICHHYYTSLLLSPC